MAALFILFPEGLATYHGLPLLMNWFAFKRMLLITS
jgi:hypothetical protein